ncbi:hypothetical protein [Mycolicibacterium porcinum]|uniref:PE-PPE domain-containing protein n=1 Tax=Mycolicibacterium porcinum TaxID=39693 RepID=A0ABV3VBJ6_9MYCO
MAVRPLVTTGVALLSAGALVAGTPALFVPRDETAIVAGEASAAAPQKRAVTVNELKLLGLADLDPQFMSDIFFRTDGYGGHVGGTYDPYYGGDNYGLFELNVQTGGTAENPVYSPALDAKGNRLYAYLDEDGNPQVGDTAIYVKDANGHLTQVSGDEENPPTYASGNGISGEIYRDGLVGLAYYLGDLALEDVMGANVPLISDAAAFVYNNVTSYFYEGGIEETFRVVASELTGGINGPVGQALATAELVSHNWLPIAGQLAVLAAAGVPLAGPDLAAATSIFFFGGPVVEDGKSYNQGIDGVINYVVDRVLGAQAPGTETDPEDTGESGEGDAASTKRSVATLASASSALPSLKNLINLNVKADEAVPVEAAVEQTPETQKTDGVAEVAAEKLGLKLANADTLKKVATQEESEESEGAGGATESAGSTGADDASDAGTPATGDTSSPSTHESSSTQVKKSPVDKFVDNATRDLKKAFGGSSNRNANRQSGSTAGQSTTKTGTDASGTDSASSGSSGSSSSSSTGGSSSSGSSSSSTGGSSSSSSSGSGSGDTGNGHKEKKDNKTKKADKHKSDS